MPVIAITGGAAAGKSQFARLFRSLLQPNAPGFDTDVCARELLAGDAEVAEAVHAEFGPAVGDSQGGIDRASLREQVFSAPERRRALEAILHPRIRTRWRGWIEEQLQKDRNAILGVEIPLLYETDAAPLFDRVITVGCGPGTQLFRLTNHRRLPEAIARGIVASQLDLAEKIRRCDHLIWNDGSEDGLEAQARLCAGYHQSVYPSPSQAHL